MSRALARKLFFCALIVLLLLSCDSDLVTEDDLAQEEEAETLYVTIGEAKYVLSEDGTTITPLVGSAAYTVTDWQVTIMGVTYTLVEEYDESGKLIGYTTVANYSDSWTSPETIELVYTGPLGDLVATASASGTSYELEGYTLSLGIDYLPSTAEKDGVEYTISLSSASSTYTATLSYSTSLGTLFVIESLSTSGETVTEYELSGYTVDFPYATANGITYLLGEDDSSDYDYSYTISYTAEGTSVDFGTITVRDGVYATVEDDSAVYTVYSSAFTYIVKEDSSTTTYSISLDDSLCTYSTSETAEAVYTGSLGDLTVITKDGTAWATLLSETFELESSVFTFTVQEESVTTTYQITLSSTTYSASTVTVVTVYEGERFGDITLTESFGSAEVTLGTWSGEEPEVTLSGSTLYVTEEGSSGTSYIEVYLNDVDYVYTTSEDETTATYTGAFGTITVTTKGSTVTAVMEDGTVLDNDTMEYIWVDGSVTSTCTIILGSGTYSYTVDLSVALYYSTTFGTITVTTENNVSSAVMADGTDIGTLSGSSFTYTVESGSTVTEYTVTLLEDYSYSVSKDRVTETLEGDLGCLTVTTDCQTGVITASFEGESDVYTVEDSEFEYVETTNSSVTTTYTIALLSDTSYTAASTKVVTVYTGSLGNITATAVYGSTTVEIDGTSYTVDHNNSFTYESSTSSITVTLDAETYTYTTDAAYETYTASDDSADLGDVTVTEGTTAVVGGDYSSAATVEDDEFTYSLSDGNTVTSYTVTLESESYTYTATAYKTVVTYEGRGEFGDFTVTEEDGETSCALDVAGESFAVTYSSGSYQVTVDGTLYTLETEDDEYSYIANYTCSEGADLGVVTVTDGTEAAVGSDTYTLSGSTLTVSVTEDNVTVTYELELSANSYTSEVTKTVTTYSGAFGTITVTETSSGSTAVIAGVTGSFTVSGSAFTYTKSGSSYLITLSTDSYSYSYEKSYSGGLGTLTVITTVDKDGESTVAASIDGGSVTVSDGYTAVLSGITYTLTLSSSTYSYSAVYTASSSSEEDLGAITVSEGTRAAIEDVSGTLTVSSDAITYKLTNDNATITYTITLSTKANTYTAVITSSKISYNGYFGTITVTDGTSATVGSGTTSYTVSDGSFSYTSGSYTYTVTLDDEDYLYISARYVYYTTTGSLGTLTETHELDYASNDTITYSIGSTTISSFSAAKVSGVTYVITLDTDNLAYTYTATYTAASGATSFGSIVITNGTSAVVGSTTATVSSNSISYTTVSYATSVTTTITYKITFSTSANTYSTSVTTKVVVSVFTGTYGTITQTATTSGSTTTYSYSYADNASYSETFYSNYAYGDTGLAIYVGYVAFEVVLNTSSHTYTATDVCYSYPVLCGYGEYRVGFTIGSTDYLYYLYVWEDGLDVWSDFSNEIDQGKIEVDEKGTTYTMNNGALTMTFSSATKGTLSVDFGGWDYDNIDFKASGTSISLSSDNWIVDNTIIPLIATNYSSTATLSGYTWPN